MRGREFHRTDLVKFGSDYQTKNSVYRVVTDPNNEARMAVGSVHLVFLASPTKHCYQLYADGIGVNLTDNIS